MTRIMDYRGAFIAKIVHMLIISIISFVYIWRERSGKEFRDKMLLLDDFGIPPENEMTVVANSTEEIVLLAKVATAFALEHGADRARVNTYCLITDFTVRGKQWIKQTRSFCEQNS